MKTPPGSDLMDPFHVKIDARPQAFYWLLTAFGIALWLLALYPIYYVVHDYLRDAAHRAEMPLRVEMPLREAWSPPMDAVIPGVVALVLGLGLLLWNHRRHANPPVYLHLDRQAQTLRLVDSGAELASCAWDQLGPIEISLRDLGSNSFDYVLKAPGLGGHLLFVSLGGFEAMAAKRKIEAIIGVPDTTLDASEPEDPVSNRTAVQELRNGILYGTLHSSRGDYDNLDGVEREWLDADSDERRGFAAAVVELLDDDDAEVQEHAVSLLSRTVEATGVESLLAVLERGEARFKAALPKFPRLSHFPNLYVPVLLAAARAAGEAHPRLIQRLRDAAVGDRQGWMVGSLARLDPEWLCEHAMQAVPHKNTGGLLKGLIDARHRERILRALVPWPPAVAQTVLASNFWGMLEIPADEVERLRAIVASSLSRADS